jgi:hypothetical protein
MDMPVIRIVQMLVLCSQRFFFVGLSSVHDRGNAVSYIETYVTVCSSSFALAVIEDQLWYPSLQVHKQPKQSDF